MTENTQRPLPVSVPNTVAVQQQQPEVLPDSGVARRLQGLHPRYERANPYAFRAQFLNDSTFRNQYLDDVIGLSVKEDPELATLFAEKPEALQRTKANMLATYTRDLYKDASTGEDVREAIVGRAVQLQGPNPNISLYAQAIETFPENYVPFGITDGKKPGPIFNEPGAFQKLISSDQELQKQVYKDRYNLFLGQLSKNFNSGVININDADEIAKAFAVYENYNSEGLTKYVNYSQSFVPGVPLEQQDRAVRDSHRFFNTPDAQGKNPNEVIAFFIGSPEDPNGQLTYRPKQESIELSTNVPLDRNAFTMAFQVKGMEQGGGEVFNKTLKSFDNGQVDFPYNSQRVSNILKSIESGIPSKDALEVSFDIMAKARNNEEWSMSDLIDTVATNAQDVRVNDQGQVQYVVDPSKLNPYTRLAMEALRMDSMYGAKMFMPGEGGTLLFDPGRIERLQSDMSDPTSKAFFRRVDRIRTPLFDDNGQLVGYDEKFDGGFGNNSLVALGNAGRFFSEYLLQPLTQATSKVFEVAGRPDVADKINTSEWYTDLKDLADFDPYQEVSTWGGTGALIASDLGLYILSALNIGRAATGVAGAAFSANASRAASMAHKARSTGIAARFMQNPVTPTLTQARALKTAKILENNPVGLANMLNIEIGAAALEGIGGQERSLWANPVVDAAFDAIGVQTDIEKAYMTSDNLTRMGMDMLGSVGIGVAFDNIWAGVKYSGNLYRASKGKTSRGLTLVEQTGKDGTPRFDYEQVATPEFAPEWRRFLHNSLNGLQEMPLGTLAESKANMFLGKQLARHPDAAETLNDAMAIMNNEYSTFFTGIRDDIEKSVRYYDEKFGGRMRYSEEQLQPRVDKLYNEMFDNIADGITNIYREQDPTKRDLIRVMTGAMEQAGGNVKTIEYADETGVRTLMSMEEANATKLQYPNSFVTAVEQSNGSMMYTVNQVDDGFWGVRLSQAINKKYNQHTVSEVVDKNARQQGIDILNLRPQDGEVISDLTAKANQVIGKEVIYNNERGYITEFLGDTYTVRTVDGNEYTGVKLPATELDLLSRQARQLTPMEQLSTQLPGTLRMLETTNPLQELRPQSQFLLGRGTPIVSDNEMIQTLRESFKSKANADQILSDIDQGVPFDSILGRMRQLGVSETEVRQTMNEGFESKIASRERSIQRTLNTKQKPEVKSGKIRELQEEIDVLRTSQSEYDTRLANVYRSTGTKAEADEALLQSQLKQAFGDDPVTTLAQKWVGITNKARKIANEGRLVTGRRPLAKVPGGDDAFRQTFGVGRGIMNQVRQTTAGRFEITRESVRNLVMALGSDNNLVDNLQKIAYNKGTITPFVPETNIKKGTLVVDRGQAFIARANIKEAGKEVKDSLPSTWIFGMDNKLHLNPYWASVEPNHTINPITGRLNEFVKVGDGTFGTIYRQAKETDPVANRVFLNVQKPSDKLPKDLQHAFAKDIDGVYTTRGGESYYEVFNEADQAIAVNRVDAFDASMTQKRKELIKVKDCK
jgi:hypothetical protein